MNIARLRNRILQMLRSTVSADAFEKNNYLRGWMHGVQFAATYVGEAVDEMEESFEKARFRLSQSQDVPGCDHAGFIHPGRTISNFPSFVRTTHGWDVLETYDRQDNPPKEEEDYADEMGFPV